MVYVSARGTMNHELFLLGSCQCYISVYRYILITILVSVRWCPECRIVSSATPEVVSFKASKDLKPGIVEWANYVKVTE